MSVHVVIATFKFKTVEDKDTFLEILNSDNGLSKTRDCNGCIQIDCCSSNHNDKQIVIFQKWQKQADHEAYLQMRKESGMFDILEGMLSGPLEIDRYTLQEC